MLTDQLTNAQAAALEEVADKLGCWPDDVQRADSLITPPQLAIFEIGAHKGRAHIVVIDEEGNVTT